MKLAPPLRRAPLAALALALAASARTAAADPPPSDLPPVTPPPSGPAPAPGPGPKPLSAQPPGRPMTPPGMPPGWQQPGLSSMSPGEIPPGYAAPPGYTAPGYYPYAAPYAAPQPQAYADPYALPPLPPRRRHDTGLFVGGVVAVVGGMSMVLIGSYFVSSAVGRIDVFCDTPSAPCAHKTDEPRLTGGAIMMAAGAAIGAAGVPMWFIGSQLEVVPKGEKKPALVPEVRVGLGSAAMSLRF